MLEEGLGDIVLVIRDVYGTSQDGYAHLREIEGTGLIDTFVRITGFGFETTCPLDVFIRVGREAAIATEGVKVARTVNKLLLT